MAYGYYRTITIDNTKVPGDLTDHPFLFNTTHNDLRVTGSGGHVTSASGYDIVFSPNIDGSSPYAHEIERYVGATGEFIAHVKIPSISSSTPTVFYIVYGDSGVTTSQENITGVWDANFKAVWHLGETSGSAMDSTSNSHDGTFQGDLPDSQNGQIGKSQDFDATGDYISVPTSADFDFRDVSAKPFTISIWFDADTFLNGRTALAIGSGDYDSLQVAVGIVDGGDFLWLVGSTSGSAWDLFEASNDAVVVNTKALALITRTTAGVYTFYLDGADAGGAFTDATDIQLNNYALKIGGHYSLNADWYWDGLLDECRISNIVRSTDYITATYNNQNSPGTFYTLGAEQGSAAEKNVSDTASGAGALSITVAASVSDVGAGAGELSITVAVPVSDVSEGTDAVTLVTPIGLSDSGVGAESIAITVSLAISDSGVGTDSPDTGLCTVVDEGVGTDVVSAITVDLAISDTAVGAEDISTVSPVPLSDSGAGSESISITVSLSITDLGAGSEVAAGAIEITEADTATGGESIAIEVAVPISDDGGGVGTLAIVVVTSLADTAEGTDSLVDDGGVGVIGRGPQDHIHLDTTSAPAQTYHITKWKPISHRMITIEHSVHGGTIAHAVPDLRYRMWEIEMLLTQSELTILRADLAASHLFYFRAIDHSPGHPSEDIIRVYATQMPSEEFIDPLLQKARVKLVLMEDPW